MSIGLSVLGTLALLSCSSDLVQDVAWQEPLPLPVDAAPAPLRVDAVVNATRFGEDRVEYVFGLSCAGPYGRLPGSLGEGHGHALGPEAVALITERLRALGYDTVDWTRMLFRQERELERARFLLSGRILEYGMELCRHQPLLALPLFGGGGRQVSGRASLAMEWHLFDPILKRTVLITGTLGYAEIATPGAGVPELLLRQAVGAAAERLGSDESFRRRVLEGGAPKRLFRHQATVGPPGSGPVVAGLTPP